MKERRNGEDRRRTGRRRRVLVWVLWGITVAGGFCSLEAKDRRIEDVSADNRQVLVDLVCYQAGVASSAPANASPELVEAFRQAAERGEAFRTYALGRLDEKRCPPVPPAVSTP